MVDVIGRAKVVITGDVDSRSIDSAGSKIGAGLKKGAVIGAAALGTLAVAGFSAYKSFEEAEAQSRKLTQVLDNMGKSEAAPAVEKLADELRKLTGIDDEVIKQGQTLLATFSEVAKSAGEVGGTFDRATRAAVDLSAAGFGDVSSASKSLGKALQDPVKGITALSRAGVTFTEEQKKLIEGFVEANDVASAQELILKEVEKQVKGTAEASATESAKISTAFGEIKETLGGMVAELIEGEDGADSFADTLERVNDELTELSESDGWKTVREVLRLTGGAIGFVAEKIGDLLAASERAGERTGLVVDDMVADWKRWKDNVVRFSNNVVTSIKNIPDRIGQNASEWAAAGGRLLSAFIGGFADGVVPVKLAQKIKDAINDALPDSVTFFGGRGGLPPIEVAIPQFASGTRNFGGGLALVGETGPELVGLPAGSDVYNPSESARMLTAQASSTVNNYWQFYGPESLSQARRDEDWSRTYGTRFGSAASAAAR